MKHTLNSILFLALLVSFFSMPKVAMAQPKAIKQADLQFELGNYYEALELYKKGSAKVKNKQQKADITLKQALCYVRINDTKRAEVTLAKAIKAKNESPDVILMYADMLRANEKYDEALNEYQRYLKLKPGDQRANIGAESSKLAVQWKANPTKHQISNVQGLNTKYDDFSPVFSKKGYREIIFTSSREGSKGNNRDAWTGQIYSDLYESKQDKSGKWSTPSPLPEPINSKFNEGAITFNGKFAVAYFTRCPIENKKKQGCQIYKTKRNGNNWEEPEVIAFAEDSFTVGHPTLSPSEELLVFASDMNGGFGGRDLWYATYDKKKKAWSKPINMGPSINTSGDELYPSFRNDSTLYFSSNGHIGMGGLDMYECRLIDGKWGQVANLKFPLNSSGDDFGIIFKDKTESGFFSSNRAGGKGGDDIYEFSVPPILFTLSGIVYDKDTRNPIPGATVKITDKNGIEHTATTDQMGAYFFDDKKFKEDNSYEIVASADDFLNDIGKEITEGEKVGRDIKHDFFLKTTKVVIRLPKIEYDLGKWDLRPSSKDSLNGLIQILRDNPNITIELMSHTDSRNDAKSNIILSQRRAEEVVKYLIEQKIDPDRLSAKGYGETRLLNRCADGVKCSEEEHQINRRTEFRITGTNFVAKEGSVEFRKPVIRVVDEDEEVQTDVEEIKRDNIQLDRNPPAPQTAPKNEAPKTTAPQPNKPKQ